MLIRPRSNLKANTKAVPAIPAQGEHPQALGWSHHRACVLNIGQSEQGSKFSEQFQAILQRGQQQALKYLESKQYCNMS